MYYMYVYRYIYLSLSLYIYTYVHTCTAHVSKIAHETSRAFVPIGTVSMY